MEIYLYGEWGTITHHSAGTQDAHVACRQLGYDTRCENKNRMIVSGFIYFDLHYIIDGYTDVSLCCARFGEGSGPIHMHYLGCSGTEHKLVDCSDQSSTHYFYDYDDGSQWSVTCTNGKDYYFCGYIICHARPMCVILSIYNDLLYYQYILCII